MIIMVRKKCTIKKSFYGYEITDTKDNVLAIASTLKEAKESAKIEATNRDRVYIAKIERMVRCR